MDTLSKPNIIINTASPTFKKLEKVFTGSDFLWKVEEADIYVTGKVGKKGFAKHFTQKELDSVTPYLFSLIKDSVADENYSLAIVGTWHYWNTPSVYIHKSTKDVIQMGKVEDYNPLVQSYTDGAPNWEVKADLFHIKNSNRKNAGEHRALKVSTWFSVSSKYLNTHFPEFLTTVKAGAALGLSKDEIVKNLNTVQWADVSLQLPTTTIEL